MNIVAMLRVKNEARWIAEVLAAVDFCSARYVMDDHSTDDTAAIARDCGAQVLPSPFDDLDESRDKEWLAKHIAAEQPPDTWVLAIDGDEILAAGSQALIEHTIATNPQVPAYAFKILYLWDTRAQARVDGVYGHFSRPSLFRLGGSLEYLRTSNGGHFHCSSIPKALFGKCKMCAAVLLHLGYMHREDRLRKYEWYNRLDPGNVAEDCYRHMVIGDVFPATARFHHAGPLQLSPV